MPKDVAESFVEAIARHDESAFKDLLAEEVDFRGLTPGRFWEADSPEEVADVVLGHWFAESDRIDEVTRVEHGEPVGDTERLSYRFAITNDSGIFTAEQQVYYRALDGRIEYLRVLCSGFRRREP
jgi:hypothetical protein